MEAAEIAMHLAVAIMEKMPITRADAGPRSTGDAVGDLYVSTLQKVTQGLKDTGLYKSG